ncbi:MAG TPA: DUF4185 domain-containing protein, partial [Mycobacterium sp.]
MSAAHRIASCSLIAVTITCLVIRQGLSSAHADPPAPMPQPVLQPLAPGEVIRIGPTAGTGTPTGDYGIGATDLCVFMDFPTQVVQVCGDSFAGQGVGFGGYYSPIALRVDTSSVDDPDGVKYTGVTGVTEPLLADPTPSGDSQLPAGVVQINRQNYLLVTTTKDLVPQSSRIVKADPARGLWQTVPGSVREADYAGGRQSQISGYYDPIPTPESQSGWVYIVADNFDRSQPAVLYRVAPENFGDRSRWQGWAPGPGGGWGKPPTPLWGDQIGEISFAQIDGKAVLSYFNSSTGNMEVRVADDPMSLSSAPVTTVVQHDEWPEPAESLPPPHDNRLAQPYGGYISPGSTLDEL